MADEEMRTKFERTAQPRASREIYTQQNPEEDFAKSAQPERSEGNPSPAPFLEKPSASAGGFFYGG